MSLLSSESQISAPVSKADRRLTSHDVSVPRAFTNIKKVIKTLRSVDIFVSAALVNLLLMELVHASCLRYITTEKWDLD